MLTIIWACVHMLPAAVVTFTTCVLACPKAIALSYGGSPRLEGMLAAIQ